MTTPLTDPVDEAEETTATTDAPPADAPETPEEDAEAPEYGETFPRAVVEKLRRENASYRDRAKAADKLAERLHTALVEQTGRLADASDLPFDAAHLDDPEALTAAVDALVAAKPHLASRTPRGDVGQGATGGDSGTVDLMGILRRGA